MDLEHVAQLPGGILLAEGGMGKTTFMKQLRDSIHNQSVEMFELGEYVDDPGTLQSDLSNANNRTVIFDGLDEAPKLAGTILRSLRNKSSTIWIASRDIEASQVSSVHRATDLGLRGSMATGGRAAILGVHPLQ